MGSDTSPVAPSIQPAATTSPAPLHTDWLRNTLTVSGTAEGLAGFRDAAAGSGVIPWRYDLGRMEEDWFLGLAAPPDGERAISLQGARILARRLRDAVTANHQRALARKPTDRRCPFDLQRLLPIPERVLRLGPDDPEAQAWLWSHWGTIRALRHIRELPAEGDRRRRKMAELRVEFWSADWSPWQALLRLRKAWPRLTLVLTPDYAEPGDA